MRLATVAVLGFLLAATCGVRAVRAGDHSSFSDMRVGLAAAHQALIPETASLASDTVPLVAVVPDCPGAGCRASEGRSGQRLRHDAALSVRDRCVERWTAIGRTDLVTALDGVNQEPCSGGGW